MTFPNVYHLPLRGLGGWTLASKRRSPQPPPHCTRVNVQQPHPYLLWSSMVFVLFFFFFNEDSPKSSLSLARGSHRPIKTLFNFSLRRVIPRIEGSHVLTSQESNQSQESWVSPQPPFSLNADISPTLSLSAKIVRHVSIPHST